MKYRILGTGLITCLGKTKEEYWDSINHQRRIFEPIVASQYQELKGFYCGRINDFDEVAYSSETRLSNLDRNSALVVFATKAATKDAFDTELFTLGGRTGVVIGTTLSIGTSVSDYDESVLVEGARHCRLGLFPNTVMNAPASRAAITQKITGPSTTISSGSNSGIDAIGLACLTLSEEDATDSIMICGGSEALSEKLLLGLARRHRLLDTMADLSQANPKPCRGLIPTEGSVIFVVNSGHGRKIGSSRYGAILSYSCTFFPFKKRQVFDRAQFIYKTIMKAIQDAQIEPSDIGLFLLGPTFDSFSFQAALNAVTRLLGVEAKDCLVVPTTELLGECFAASGPQLVLISQGYLDERLDEGALVRLNINEQWGGDVIQKDNVLIIQADPAGHNSALVMTR